MRRFVLTFITILSSAFFAFGQYAPQEEQSSVLDVTSSKEYKSAKRVMISGIAVAGVGLYTGFAGSIVCMIKQNKYIKSHYSSGGIEEYARYYQEAKTQPGYKTGQILEIAGSGVLLVGGGLILFGSSRMKKIRNSSGETVAIVDYGATPYGAGFSLSF